MNKNDFLKNFADQFDETEPEEISMDTEFQELEEWSSLIGLSVLNIIAKKYGVRLAFNDLISVNTVQELYDMVSSKAA